MNDKLRSSYDQLRSLLVLCQTMNTAESRECVGEVLLEVLREILPYRGAAILLYEEGELRRQKVECLTPDLDRALVCLCDEKTLGRVREGAHPVVLDAEDGPDGNAAYAVLPLHFQGEFLGAVCLILAECARSLTRDRLQVVEVVAGQAAAAFHNAAAMEHNHLYQQLQALLAIKSDLTNMVIHDLRSPLMAIMGNIESALFLSDEERQKEILHRALNGCDGLLILIGNLLDVSRMEEGKLQICREPIALEEIVAPNLEMLGASAERWNKPIVCQFPPDLPLLNADRDLLRRVVNNLLTNALKYGPAGKAIEVNAHWSAAEGAVVVSVTDRGPGISPEYHEKIFQKFGQVEAKRSRQRTGSGLGLTFCCMAVEAHGGRIWLESAPGEFTRFLFTIPDGA